ncbi:hypothetical protein B0J12DRAFT_700481 [Macrophomina phaseolina]|uniref:Uncharacterized protein n=1 Tax=Macrophomina phaseolina TaxID=35725 RepID=A0ABQ8G7M9_9PEZI|nr:hypothetical protein B0J12DRAFT_700481 [Macrophomina phaseolina]
MPTYKGITLSLRSAAHDTAPLLEFPPPPHHAHAVAVEDAAAATAAVYVLASPGLAFWIAYHVKPPVPPEARFFVFKLFMEGRHVVSWGVGEEEGWRGTTMFGLFEESAWKGGVEKRAFAFGGRGMGAGEDHESRVLEVRVLRARARVRVQREMSGLGETEVGKKGAGGIDLVNAGRLKKENPKRFYKFALIDSLRTPYATFRYYYRSEGMVRLRVRAWYST